jgi:small conductance mechanosensitive channel
MLETSLNKQAVDVTMVRYTKSVGTATLNVLLLVGILGYLGIQTTTFAALLAAAGVAIGMAWAGLLANFAAGVFLIILRPFKVGNQIHVAGITGVVVEIGLFSTTINTSDNILTMVGNNKIFSDNIQNFSANAYRRVDLQCQLAGVADHNVAMTLLREKISAIPNVLAQPPIDVEILEFTLVGPVLAVRPYCDNAHYWQVYFDTNRIMRESLAAAGFPAPMPAQMTIVHQDKA